MVGRTHIRAAAQLLGTVKLTEVNGCASQLRSTGMTLSSVPRLSCYSETYPVGKSGTEVPAFRSVNIWTSSPLSHSVIAAATLCTTHSRPAWYRSYQIPQIHDTNQRADLPYGKWTSVDYGHCASGSLEHKHEGQGRTCEQHPSVLQ